MKYITKIFSTLVGRLRLLRRCASLVYQQYVGVLDHKDYGQIGRFTSIAENSLLVKSNMFLDDWCVVQKGTVFIARNGKLVVKKYSVLAAGCIIIPDSHRLTVGVPFLLASQNHINDEDGEIIIEEDCWIGAGCILLPNCHIRRGAVVGAGSIVKKEVPPYAVVVGSPARIIAVKFDKEQILKHESILYPPEERLTEEEIDKIFRQYYEGMRTVGVDDLPGDEAIKVETLREKYMMRNYSLDR